MPGEANTWFHVAPFLTVPLSKAPLSEVTVCEDPSWFDHVTWPLGATLSCRGE